MKVEKFYSKTIAGIFFCICLIVYGTLTFIKSEQIDYNTCIFLLKKVIPYSILVALLGYFIGEIIDKANAKAKRRRKLR